jgi:hypothetical protein
VQTIKPTDHFILVFCTAWRLLGGLFSFYFFFSGHRFRNRRCYRGARFLDRTNANWGVMHARANQSGNNVLTRKGVILGFFVFFFSTIQLRAHGVESFQRASIARFFFFFNPRRVGSLLLPTFFNFFFYYYY